MLSSIDIDESLVSALKPNRSEQGHKGYFGRLLIYAGSKGMGGAAILATGAALRSGVGLVYVLSPDEIQSALMTRCPEALQLQIPSNQMENSRPKLMPLVAHVEYPKENWFASMIVEKDAVLMGPGLATERVDVKDNLPIAIAEARHLVLDAGALSVLAASGQQQAWLTSRVESGLAPAVLTPHMGEFQRLLPGWKMGDLAAAGAFAKENHVILVLKSNETNIFTPSGKWYSNHVSNSGLAKGGSGDVLSGLLTGLLATGMTEEAAAIAAVKIHSMAGEQARAEHGAYAMLPSMLWDYLEVCYHKLQWEKGSET